MPPFEQLYRDSHDAIDAGVAVQLWSATGSLLREWSSVSEPVALRAIATHLPDDVSHARLDDGFRRGLIEAANVVRDRLSTGCLVNGHVANSVAEDLVVQVASLELPSAVRDSLNRESDLDLLFNEPLDVDANPTLASYRDRLRRLEPADWFTPYDVAVVLD